MQIDIEGQQIDVQPVLRAWITKRLEELNGSHYDILHVRVTLEKDVHHMQGADEARVVLSLAGKTLSAGETGDTLDEAVDAALYAMARELQDFRTQRRRIVKESGSPAGG